MNLTLGIDAGDEEEVLLVPRSGEEFAAVYAGGDPAGVIKKSAPKTRRKKAEAVTSPEFEVPPTPVGEQG